MDTGSTQAQLLTAGWGNHGGQKWTTPRLATIANNFSSVSSRTPRALRCRFGYMNTKTHTEILDELQGEVAQARKRASEVVRRRDQYLLHLIHEGHSVRSLAASAGLSRQTIMQIRDRLLAEHNGPVDQVVTEWVARGSSLD